jgi:hypothetical protein
MLTGSLRGERDPNVAPTTGAAVDLANVGITDAAAIESAEHKALGYRPPPSSLAAAAKTAAAEHPDASAGVPLAQLHEAGRDDAARVRDQRGEPATGGIEAGTASLNLSSVSTNEARTLQSAEQKALGYRPPAGSLAAEAQAEAAKNPAAAPTASTAELVQAARADAAEVELERRGGVVVESTAL